MEQAKVGEALKMTGRLLHQMANRLPGIRDVLRTQMQDEILVPAIRLASPPPYRTHQVKVPLLA